MKNKKETVKIGDKEYDCDDLAEREREKLAKRRKSSKKTAKKRESTKNVDRIEKATDIVEENIEERMDKGEVKVKEVKTIITRLESTIDQLKQLRKKAS